MKRLLLKVAEAAELAGISRSHAYKLVKAGVWPTIRIGSSIRVPMAALEAWIENQLQGPNGEGPRRVP